MTTPLPNPSRARCPPARHNSVKPKAAHSQPIACSTSSYTSSGTTLAEPVVRLINVTSPSVQCRPLERLAQDVPGLPARQAAAESARLGTGFSGQPCRPGDECEVAARGMGGMAAAPAQRGPPGCVGRGNQQATEDGQVLEK